MNRTGRNILTLLCFWISPFAGALQLTPQAIDFGDVQIGTQSRQLRIDFKNTSATQSEYLLTGNLDNGNFSKVLTTCTGRWPLPPGQSCFWNMTYSPKKLGAETAKLSFTTTLGGPWTVQLSGRGIGSPVTNVGPKKWNPGHYAQLPPAYQDAAIKEISNIPEIKGIMISYAWGNIEKAQGQYDFSKIRHDLELLRQKGKRLVIQVSDKVYQPEVAGKCVPAYLRNGSQYLGGALYVPTEHPGGGCVAKRWIPAVMDRIIALHRALGAAFDKDPNVEGITTEESSISVRMTEGATYRSYVDQLKRLAAAMATAYPTSVASIQLNWDIYGFEQELIDYMARRGIGFGGPDTSPLHRTAVVPKFSAQFAGRTPIVMAVNATFLTFFDDPIGDGRLTLDEVFDYAVRDPAGINASHLFWWYFKKQWTPGVSYDFYDVVSLIRQRQGDINAMCPENLICLQ